MVTKVGIIGFSEGNGHPFSFSAIINGYDKEQFAAANWPVILDYLESKDETDFGVPDVEVSSVWTPNPELSQSIARATHIPHVCEQPEDMLALVDAVIIARDDWETHYPLAMKFLQQDKAVFVDKPLSLDTEQLRELKPYLENAKLMSCAALRYAVELDPYRQLCNKETPKHISGTILIDWERYGVHLLDGIYSGIAFNVESVFSYGDSPRTTLLQCTDGSTITLTCLGMSAKTFNISAFTSSDRGDFEVSDNFSAFKRTLCQFKRMIDTNTPSIPPELTLNIMKTLIAGNISKLENRVVRLDEISI